jgi:aspartyl-tRNA(Asn)/glutamyl-tRNA(Gln) amidotransferase subunit C
MNISKQEVEKVAKLARLELSETEKDTYAKQLSQILTYMQTLNRYDTTGIEPTATVLGEVNVLRQDTVGPSLTVDQALANAPERDGGYFQVPKIIE